LQPKGFFLERERKLKGLSEIAILGEAEILLRNVWYDTGPAETIGSRPYLRLDGPPGAGTGQKFSCP
jgi:hypothetical protein